MRNGIEIFTACIICGVRYGNQKFEFCNEEMDAAKIDRVDIPNHNPRHIWGEAKLVKNWHGRSIVDEVGG